MTNETGAGEERRRLTQTSAEAPWRKWGPYLSERQWGTVREDRSQGGDAWNFLTHDQARFTAYQWGEDGLAGLSDDGQILCFSVAMWNGVDPILKERAFGLTNGEGNHGEDVKEYYFYVDNTPTHSYMKYLYKYPQREFPYLDLVQTSAARGRHEWEYELLDTGVFDEDRYFDVFVEYAKASPEDILIQVRAVNRGPEAALLHLLPTIWFRNTWVNNPEQKRPEIWDAGEYDGMKVIGTRQDTIGHLYLYAEQGIPLFADNETNSQRRGGFNGDASYFKDGFHDCVVAGIAGAVNRERRGTKACLHEKLWIDPGKEAVMRLRLTNESPEALAIRAGQGFLGREFSEIMTDRHREADAFYDEITPPDLSADERDVLRRALAGMLWTKQFYAYDVSRWLRGKGMDPYAAEGVRNGQWQHMVSSDIISMPDKWEYPWYAAWDLAFHALPLALVDVEFAKQQLLLLLRERYIHPSGQVPAYEWNFGDVNPPVHAWAAVFLYQLDKENHGGIGDRRFLISCYQKLLLNFTWWVNRKDPLGRNVFEGGFLGLDNIGVFDRSAPLPTGGRMEQADGTAWMAFFAQTMLQMSLELAQEDPPHGDMALKFFEHFVWIASAMTRMGEQNIGMWDEEDGFFYDLIRLPDGQAHRLKVRSMVGLLPLCATTVLGVEAGQVVPEIGKRASWFVANHEELLGNMHDPRKQGLHGRRLLAVVNEDRLRRILARMLDENEFLSPYGIRSLSRIHREHPYSVWWNGQESRVGYVPAESDSAIFGGNSNWRGPVWFPMNTLLIRSLLHFYSYYGDDFKVECPTGSGDWMTLYQVANEIADRLVRIFLVDKDGRRPVFGGTKKFVDDPAWRDQLLFFEYFHGDNGAGLGASHQTGWTGLVANAIHYFATHSSAVLQSLWPSAGPVPVLIRPDIHAGQSGQR